MSAKSCCVQRTYFLEHGCGPSLRAILSQALATLGFSKQQDTGTSELAIELLTSQPPRSRA
jgi:hypothetical protein